jgi:hypothetical protein
LQDAHKAVFNCYKGHFSLILKQNPLNFFHRRAIGLLERVIQPLLQFDLYKQIEADKTD